MNDIRADVLLAMQVALLGMITPQIRGITCGWDLTTITIHTYYDGAVSENDEDMMEEVVTEMMSHFPNHEINLSCFRVDAPEPLQKRTLLAWVYMRQEI